MQLNEIRNSLRTTRVPRGEKVFGEMFGGLVFVFNFAFERPLPYVINLL